MWEPVGLSGGKPFLWLLEGWEICSFITDPRKAECGGACMCQGGWGTRNVSLGPAWAGWRVRSGLLITLLWYNTLEKKAAFRRKGSSSLEAHGYGPPWRSSSGEGRAYAHSWVQPIMEEQSRWPELGAAATSHLVKRQRRMSVCCSLALSPTTVGGFPHLN